MIAALGLDVKMSMPPRHMTVQSHDVEIPARNGSWFTKIAQNYDDKLSTNVLRLSLSTKMRPLWNISQMLYSSLSRHSAERNLPEVYVLRTLPVLGRTLSL
jgi:hypothetical protein